MLAKYRLCLACTLVFCRSSATRFQVSSGAGVCDSRSCGQSGSTLQSLTWRAVQQRIVCCFALMTQDTEYLHCAGTFAELLRPCTDCGQLTSGCCETKPPEGRLSSHRSRCLALKIRLPEKDQFGHTTPLCLTCKYDHFACRFCRGGWSSTTSTPK